MLVENFWQNNYETAQNFDMIKRIIIDIINIFHPAFRKSDYLTKPLLCMIIHVGEATTVK